MNRKEFDEAIRALGLSSENSNIVASVDGYSRTPYALGVAKIDGKYDVYEVDERGMHESFDTFHSEEEAYSALYAIIEEKVDYQNYIIQMKRDVAAPKAPTVVARPRRKVMFKEIMKEAVYICTALSSIFIRHIHKE